MGAFEKYTMVLGIIMMQKMPESLKQASLLFII